MAPGRNDPCYCGSGKKYKKCHLDVDRDAARRAVVEALPMLEEKIRKTHDYEQRLREEFGVHVNYVSPIQWQGGKVWAIGSRVYPGRPPEETFHEFILHLLRETLGEPWRAAQTALPETERHFILKCFEQLSLFMKEHTDPEALAREGQVSAEANGWVRYLISLAWDVATLIHAGEPPDELIDRLRDRDNFQGARYELAIAAIFARLDCSIRWLDADPALRTVKHVEFEATHSPTGQTFAVEAKSRHRVGVINQPGRADPDDPLRADARAVRRLFMNAIKKAPTNEAYFVFIDINAPREADADWQADVQQWMNRLPAPTEEAPDVFNAAYVTNFSPHYDAGDISSGGTWLVVWPRYTRVPLHHDFQPDLLQALNAYGRVPAFAEDGTLLG
ncbi:MAG: SEC-C domain-containing protein [Solirubrobacteraceae bacterium]